MSEGRSIIRLRLPGIVIHGPGDLARVYFGASHGDGGLLFVS